MKKNKEIYARGAQKPFNWKLALILVAGSLASSLLYFFLIGVSELSMKITVIAYMVAACLVAIAYVIVNKGLVADRITEDMLPEEMSNNEKAEYFEKAAQKKKDSRWMIVLLFVILVPLVLDMMKLFVIDKLFPDLFSKNVK